MARHKIYRHVRTKANELIAWSSRNTDKNDPSFSKNASHIERYLNWISFSGWELEYCAYERNTAEWHFIWVRDSDKSVGRSPFLDSDRRNPYLDEKWAARVESKLDSLVEECEDKLLLEQDGLFGKLPESVEKSILKFRDGAPPPSHITTLGAYFGPRVTIDKASRFNLSRMTPANVAVFVNGNLISWAADKKQLRQPYCSEKSDQPTLVLYGRDPAQGDLMFSSPMSPRTIIKTVLLSPVGDVKLYGSFGQRVNQMGAK